MFSLSRREPNLLTVYRVCLNCTSLREERLNGCLLFKYKPGCNLNTTVRSSIFTVLPPFIITYLIYDAAEKEHDRLQRKQPGQFDHEK